MEEATPDLGVALSKEEEEEEEEEELEEVRHDEGYSQDEAVL